MRARGCFLDGAPSRFPFSLCGFGGVFNSRSTVSLNFFSSSEPMQKPDILVQRPMIQRTDKSEPRHLPPPLNDQFYHAIGKLIATWAGMELEMNILIWALLEANQTKEPNWKGRPFEKRRALLKQEWAIFSKGLPDLSAFLDQPFKDTQEGKTLRDSISHKEFIVGLSRDGNHQIRFYNKTRVKQKSKPYFAADFQRATEAAGRAAGYFYWVTDPESQWPLPSPDISRLRSLPNTDHLKIPT